MRIPVFTDLGKTHGNTRVPDSDIIAMREMHKRKSVAQVHAAFPHVTLSYVRMVLKGQRRPNVGGPA